MINITGKEKWWNKSSASYYEYVKGIDQSPLLLHSHDRDKLPFGKIQWLDDGVEITDLIVNICLNNGLEEARNFCDKINLHKILNEKEQLLKEEVNNWILNHETLLSECTTYTEAVRLMQQFNFCEPLYKLSFWNDNTELNNAIEDLKNKVCGKLTSFSFGGLDKIKEALNKTLDEDN